jgi:hypothetical protein
MKNQLSLSATLRGITISSALLGLLFFHSSCVVDEVCPNTWMTFFVDELDLDSVPHHGVLCAKGSSCRAIPGFWGQCPDRPARPLCGPNDGWLCLGQGEFTFEIFRDDQPSESLRAGSFIMPQAIGSGCRARVYLGSVTRVQPLTCEPAAAEDILETPDRVVQTE